MRTTPFLQKARRILVGNRAFYAMVLSIVIPIVIQNAITNFVNLLDNVMVGRIGTDQMTGVSIVNQLMFVFNLCVFGGVSGAGIFAAQYHGASNPEGVANCFRYKIYLAIGLSTAALLVFIFGEEPLIRLYLNDDSNAERVAQTLLYGQKYLRIMLWGLAPFAFSQAYASTLRETGETTLPMRAGIIAVFVNLVLNYVLIYGKLGIPAMGVEGAAIATIISRYIELAIIVYITHTHTERYPFAASAYKTAKIPLPLVKQITIKGMPLLVNEALWSLGMATLAHCYSLRGLDIVSAQNISGTVGNLFNVIFLSMGNATAIIIGQELGANNTDLAKEHSWKLIAFGIFSSLSTAILLGISAPFIPLLYNTESQIQHLASRLLIINAVCMPMFSFANSSYFILRSGGKTLVTFGFDCGYTWLIALPLAFTLVKFTALPIVTVYFCVQFAELSKCILGYLLIKKGIWIHNMVAE